MFFFFFAFYNALDLNEKILCLPLISQFKRKLDFWTSPIVATYTGISMSLYSSKKNCQDFNVCSSNIRSRYCSKHPHPAKLNQCVIASLFSCLHWELRTCAVTYSISFTANSFIILLFTGSCPGLSGLWSSSVPAEHLGIFWDSSKVIDTKYSKHWPYTVAHTIECVCRKC